ncbi:MAG: AgmX/PglI C-terminal domain-containing protein [Myxococcales bacterium]|nr:AgmX/PglI C-terminal domain-containing protein [Myxococcales bacterium]
MAPRVGDSQPENATCKNKRGCCGQATDELEDALKARIAQTRACYEAALGGEPTLQGSIAMNLIVALDGSVPEIAVAKSPPNMDQVARCVLDHLRIASYPPPINGCVEIIVPINFLPRPRSRPPISGTSTEVSEVRASGGTTSSR